MKKVLILVVALALAGIARADFVDNFNTAHDYLADGLGAYDGMLDPGAVTEVLDASITADGQLFYQTNGSVWENNVQGPLLYKNITGNFIATVKVAVSGDIDNVSFNNAAGIMARDPAGTGAVENWVSIDRFVWTAFIAWNTSSTGRAELGQVEALWEDADTYATGAAYPWVQLERNGSNFYFRISADGVNFLPLTDPAFQGIYDGTQNPLVVSRPDLPDTLQVGLHQIMYDTVSGSATFDDFSIQEIPEPMTLTLLGLGALALIRKKR